MKKIGMILCVLCLSLGSSNVYAEEEPYEIFYNIDDQRYDYGESNNREIELGVYKQWLAALLLIENTRDFDKELTILYDSPIEQVSIPPFIRGDKVRIEEILNTLLITPADGVYLSTAIYIGQSEEDFLNLLDKLCSKLEMTHTDVYNDVTTTHDIVTLLSYCWKEPVTKDIMVQPVIETDSQIPLINPYRKTKDAKEIQYVFQNTDSAVAVIDIKDTNFLVIQDKLDEINTIIENNKHKYKNQRILSGGLEIGTITFDAFLFPVSHTILSQEEYATLPYTIDKETVKYEFYPQEKLQLPVFKGTKLGVLQIKDKDHLIKTIPVYNESMIISYPKYIFILVIAASIGIFEFYRRKKKLCRNK